MGKRRVRRYTVASVTTSFARGNGVEGSTSATRWLETAQKGLKNMSNASYETLISLINDSSDAGHERLKKFLSQIQGELHHGELFSLLVALHNLGDDSLNDLQERIRVAYLEVLHTRGSEFLWRQLLEVLKADIDDPELDAGMLECLKEKLRELNPRKTLWYFVRLHTFGARALPFIRVVTVTLSANLTKIRTDDLVRFFSQIGFESGEASSLLFLSKELVRRRREVLLEPEGAVALLVSFSHLGVEDQESSSRALAALTGEGASYFSRVPRIILDSLWKMRRLPTGIVEALGEWAPRISSPFHLSDAIRLLERAGCRDSMIARIFAQRLLEKLGQLNLENELVSFIRLKRAGLNNLDVIEQLEHGLLKEAGKSTTWTLGKVLHRLCLYDYRAPSLIPKLFEEVKRRDLGEDWQLAIKLMLSMSHLLWRDEELLRTLFSVISPKLPELPPETLADITMVLAQLDFVEGTASLKEQIGRWQVIDDCIYSKVVWAFSILEPSYARSLLAGVWSYPPDPEISDRELIPIYHAILGTGLPAICSWREKMKGLFLAHDVPEGSGFEREVGEVLDLLNLPHRDQEQVAGYFIDHVVFLDDVKIAVGCDGDQFHYLNWDSEVGVRGADKLRDRVLERRGYRVLHLSGREWRTSRDRAALLWRLISSVR